jgi:hypothetical protein
MSSNLNHLFPGGFPRRGAVYINGNHSLLIPIQSDVFLAGETIIAFRTSQTQSSSQSSEQTSSMSTPNSNETQNTSTQHQSENRDLELQSSFQRRIHFRRRLILNHFLEVPVQINNNDERQIQLYREERAQMNLEAEQRLPI